MYKTNSLLLKISNEYFSNNFIISKSKNDISNSDCLHVQEH